MADSQIREAVKRTIGDRARANSMAHDTRAQQLGIVSKVAFGGAAAAAGAGLYPVTAGLTVAAVVALVQQGVSDLASTSERNRGTALDYLRARQLGGSGKVADIVATPIAANAPNLLAPTPAAAPTPQQHGSLELAREAATRTAGDMGAKQTVGVGGNRVPASSSSGPQGDGQVDPYTRVQNGTVVQVGGYQLPAGRR